MEKPSRVLFLVFFTVSKLETRNVDGITNALKKMKLELQNYWNRQCFSYDRNKQRCFYAKLKTEVSLLDFDLVSAIRYNSLCHMP